MTLHWTFLAAGIVSLISVVKTADVLKGYEPCKTGESQAKVCESYKMSCAIFEVPQGTFHHFAKHPEEVNVLKMTETNMMGN